MNLYLRLVYVWVHALLQPPIRLGDTIELQKRVWPNDIDVNGHMNNGRYMTITDLALLEYFTRLGFLKVMYRNGWRPMFGGSMISFRRGLKPFHRYTVRFSVICWDDRWNYMHFEFVRSGKVFATGYAKGAVVGASGIIATADSHAALGVVSPSPVVTRSVAAWIAADRMIRFERLHDAQRYNQRPSRPS